MRNSKTFLLSSTFNAFILIFTFFVALIYIEDIYIFRQLEKTNEILPLIYIGRVFIALSFSLAMAVIMFLYTYSFTNQLKNFCMFISNTRFENYQDKMLTKKLAYNELIELRDTLVETYNNYLENESIDKNNHTSNLKIDLISKLLPVVYNIKLNPIENLDVAVLPNKSEKSFSDLIEIVDTRNGCIVCMTGSPLDNLNSSIYKLKVKSTLLAMKSFSHLVEEELFHDIFRLVNEYITEKTNMFIAYISKNSNKLIYHKFQNKPIFLLKENSSQLLSSIEEEYLDKKFSNTNPIGIEFKVGEYLLILSDRLEMLNEFRNNELSDYLNKKLNSFERNIKTSRDLILNLITSLESWQKDNHGNGNILEYLTCIAIRKKN
jgi:Arg-Lys translocation region protein phosphatase